MFLNQLSDVEKQAFISMGVHLANANGMLEDSEKEMLNDYCSEMRIPFESTKEICSMEDVIGIFAKSSEHVKKVVLLEAMGLAYADGSYDLQEREFVETFADGIGLPGEVIPDIEDMLKKYLLLVAEIIRVIQ